MKKTVTLICLILTFVLAICLSVMFIIGYFSHYTVRWDKIPVIGIFAVEIDKPSAFDASSVEEPIRWDQIDEPPEDYPDDNLWFWMNSFTKNILKQHMRENNLGIVPKEYLEFHFSADFEECLEIFEFVELDESYRSIDYELIENRKRVKWTGISAAIMWLAGLVSTCGFIVCVTKQRGTGK